MLTVDPHKMMAHDAGTHRVSRVYYGDRNYRPNEWNVLADLEGPGVVTHVWITYPQDAFLGRRVLLRCFWDDEPEPSVEAPVGDFFGVPCGLSGRELRLDTPWLVLAPQNGLNYYFPMPFARHARIEIMPSEEVSLGGFYVQIDYCSFAKGLPSEWSDIRFHAQFRMENPCEQYGRNYLFLDATGNGMLAGATFGIAMRYPQPDAWFHGGGDTMLIDGESHPKVLHGIGAEDFFGHAWGVQKFNSCSIGTPYEEIDDQGRLQRLGLYRFFVNDPVFFSRSIRATLGALGNAYSSVAYWYQTEPHRPFFRVPAVEARMPEAEVRYGQHDLAPRPSEDWLLLAPFPCNTAEPFDTLRPFEKAETGAERVRYTPVGVEGFSKPSLPGGESMEVRWRQQTAYHHFVDFHMVARPAITAICLQTEVVGYALRYVESPSACVVEACLGFDDEASVRVNDRECFRGCHARGFREARFPVELRAGRNRILVKLSNLDNDNWRFWGFSFRLDEPSRSCRDDRGALSQ